MIAFGLILLVAAAWAAPQEPIPPTLTVYGVQRSPLSGGLDGAQAITLKDVEVRPLLVLADISSGQNNVMTKPAAGIPRQYAAYYLHHGLRSVRDYDNFKPLYQYFDMNNVLSSFVFFPDKVFNPSFLKSYVNDVVLPENFNFLEFIKALSYPVPVMIVAPQQEFLNFNFKDISDIGTFVFSNSSSQVPAQQQNLSSDRYLASLLAGFGPSPINYQPSYSYYPGAAPYNPYYYPTLVIPRPYSTPSFPNNTPSFPVQDNNTPSFPNQGNTNKPSRPVEVPDVLPANNQ